MPAYQHILVALDLSPESALVYERASEIRAQSGGELSLVHVMEAAPLGYMISEIGADFGPIYEDVKREWRNTLLKFGASRGIAENRLHNLIGSPAHEIRNLAKTVNADLIVVGGHGKHGFELLLGSVSTGVAHGVPCDLLIVRLPS